MKVDFGACIYCGASGCESDTAEHATDCPSSTGVFPVDENTLGPRCPHCSEMTNSMQCADCGTDLAMGESYMLREIEPADPGLPGVEGASVSMVVCLGCGVLAS